MRPYFGIAISAIGAYVIIKVIKGVIDKKYKDKYEVQGFFKDLTGGLLLMAAGIYMMLGY